MAILALKLRSRSRISIFVSALLWCLCVPNLVRIHQKFLTIFSGNHLSYPVTLNDLENKVKVTQFELRLCLAWCLFVRNFLRIYEIFLQIFSRHHLSYPIALNDLYHLTNKVKSTRFNLCPLLALVHLCTKFGEDTSN